MDEQQFVDFMGLLVYKLEKVYGVTSNEKILFELTDMIDLSGLPYKECLKIKPSKIHGMGVFANDYIDCGQVITMYPCHAIGKSETGIYQERRAELMAKYKDVLDEYKIVLPNEINIIGIPELKNTYLLGHLINDPFPDTQIFDEFNNPSDCNNDKMLKKFGKYMKRYIRYTLKYSNCAIVRTNQYVYIRALKDIADGEELTAAYGFSYWCKKKDPNEIFELYARYYHNLSVDEKKEVNELNKQIDKNEEPLKYSEQFHASKDYLVTK